MSEYEAGDLLEATKGEEVTRGRVQSVGGIRWVGANTALSWLLANGYTITVIERAKPPLPTVPGWYADKDGGLWRLSDSGRWLYGSHRASDVAEYAPFTRLVPETDTADILDRLRVAHAACTNVTVVAGAAFCARTILADLIADLEAKQ